jgi:phosphoribosyl 1,2-cyclic phosphate phosphodiesterase
MKIKIIGSGGCTCTPKPLCQCKICREAREKGKPYSRFGCSLYLEDAALLVDTPENIAEALNYSDIKKVDNILYSHWDPDHTLGMRIMEQLRLEWLDYYDGLKPPNPITVYAHPEVMADLNGIRSKFGAILDYYEYMGLIKRQTVAGDTNDQCSFTLGNLKVTMVRVPKEKAAMVFVFELAGKKAIYSPCDCKPYPESDLFYDADLLVMGNTVLGATLKDGRTLTAENPLRAELHSFDSALQIKEKYRIKRMLMTHIEETWGKSYDDYRAWEKELNNVEFAYDGMEIEL